MEKTLGRKPKQLEDLSVHSLPEGLSYLWGWFEELFNAGKLSYQEIDAWNRLTRRNVTPQEVEAIKTLDLIFLKVQNDGRR